MRYAVSAISMLGDFVWGSFILLFGDRIGERKCCNFGLLFFLEFLFDYFYCVKWSGFSSHCMWYIYLNLIGLNVILLQLYFNLTLVMTGTLKLITWNVQEIGHVIKRKKILTHLKKQKSDITLLQETRLSEHLKLKRDWVGHTNFSSHLQNKRGTAILIKKNLPFILEHEEKDPEGRFILITGSILHQHINILNVYAPNQDSPHFISQIILMFNHYCKDLGFLAGDFNCIMNATLDKSSPANPGSLNILHSLSAGTGLIDVWRQINPNVSDYTFYSHPHNSYSRLVYLFIPKIFLMQFRLAA